MLSVEKDDYVIVTDITAKKFKGRLVRVTRNNKGSCRGVLVTTKMEDDEELKNVEFGTSDVLAVLGQDPPFGTAYNCKIEIPHGTAKTKFGTMHYWRNLKRDDRVRIEKMLALIYPRMKKDKILLGKDIDLTIREPAGTMIGHYKRYNKDDRRDELCIQQKAYDKKTLPLSELKYIFCHEYGHGLWFTRMTPELQGEWIKAYSRNVTLSRVKSDRVDKLRAELLETGKVNDFAKQLDDEDKETFKECMKYVKRLHSIMPRHVNALLVDGSDLVDYWPKNGVSLQHKQIVVSEYGMKSPDEFWCEAFAQWYADTKVLPKSVEKLMLKTMKELKASSTTATNMDDDFHIGSDDDD